MFLLWKSCHFHCIYCRGQLQGSDSYHIITSMTFPYTPAITPSTFPSLPVRTTVLKTVYIQGNFCTICHIHIYFPFTMGHLNHTRIYYHHADSAPADNTNHDKMEQWLHKHPRLYIISYELGAYGQIPLVIYVSAYLYG